MGLYPRADDDRTCKLWFRCVGHIISPSEALVWVGKKNTTRTVLAPTSLYVDATVERTCVLLRGTINQKYGGDTDGSTN